jgi:hypothetical protein
VRAPKRDGRRPRHRVVGESAEAVAIKTGALAMSARGDWHSGV